MKKIFRKMKKNKNEEEFFQMVERVKFISDGKAVAEIKNHYKMGSIPLIVNRDQVSFTYPQYGADGSTVIYYWYYIKEVTG